MGGVSNSMIQGWVTPLSTLCGALDGANIDMVWLMMQVVDGVGGGFLAGRRSETRVKGSARA